VQDLRFYRCSEDIIVLMCYLKWAAFTSGKLVPLYETIYRDSGVNSNFVEVSENTRNMIIRKLGL